MATRNPLSPLLSPWGRCGGDTTTLFLEMAHLSGLYLASFSMKLTLNTVYSYDDELHLVKDFHTPTKVDSFHQENVIENVIDRDEHGNEAHVNYEFNFRTKAVMEVFKQLGISSCIEIYKHKEARLNVDKSIFYCKNLFLKDRNGSFYLVICHEDCNIDLKQLRKDLKACRNFNFGTANDMALILDVEPGGVTPLALMNQSASSVTMVIHTSLEKTGAVLMFHPMDSTLAVKISLNSLLRYLKHFGHNVKFVK